MTFKDGAELVFEAVLGCDNEAVGIMGELCLGATVELVLEDEETVGCGILELDDLVALGKLVMPDDTIVLGDGVATGGLVMPGGLGVSAFGRDDETVVWVADGVELVTTCELGAAVVLALGCDAAAEAEDELGEPEEGDGRDEYVFEDGDEVTGVVELG